MTALLSVVSTAAWALSDVNGVYQIGTAEDLKAFAELVNGENPYANAVLTADIDKGTETYRIGRDGQDFQGVFDGAGYTITYNMTFNENGAGLFRNVGVHAVIQNLKVQGTLTSSGSFVGGIAGWNSGRIRGCYVDVNIISQKEGDATDGGIAGICYRGTVIENCLVKVDIDGEQTTNCGGVCGWADNKINIVNCLVINDGSSFKYDDASNGHSNILARNEGNLKVVDLGTYNSDPYANRPEGACFNNYVTKQWGTSNAPATTVVPFADLANGKICYQLNTDQSKINWVQDLKEDPFPVPAAFGTKQVYASGSTGCNGIADGLTYSNEGTVQAAAHTFDKYGICTTCGCFNFSGLDFDITDNAVLLKNANDIYLAEGWNRVGDGFKLNMKMANDIECVPEPGQLIFNNSNWVDGNFNGDGHTLTIAMSDITVNEAAFIPIFTGNFKNVIMHGTISTSGQYAGSITGRARGDGQKFSNVFSDITINANREGDNTTGGFIGIGHGTTNVENSIYAGTVNGVAGAECVAGFCGWAEGSTNLTNCAFLGSLNNVSGDTHTISRNAGNAHCNNVYSVFDFNGTDANKYTPVTADAVKSGELAFKLNGEQNGVDRFYQLINTDMVPMPFAKAGALVYAVAASYGCNGKPIGDDITFANSFDAVIPDHEFENGVCKNCGEIEADADGYKKVISAQSLVAFAKIVNDGQTDAKARMYADVDLADVAFTPIGNQNCLFVGEFDGQGHTISNFVYSGGDYSGLFGVIGGGAVIKNFVLDNTCSINGNAFCGIVGGTNGAGNVYLTNLGNEGTVTGTAQNVCGILGVDMGGSATLFITNCYVTGAIKGARESATICGWSNGSSVIKNCWSTASLEGIYGTGSFTRGSCSVVNGYEIESVGQQDNTNKITAAEVASGALCVKLANGWYQTVGEDAHPVWDKSHGIVKEITDAGYATMYIEDAVDVPAGVEASTGAVNEETQRLTLTPVNGVVPAWEPVVLKGAPGFYSFKPAAAAAQADVLTWEGLGLNGSNSNYTEFAGKSFTSSAEFAGIASSGIGSYIQLRTKNSNEGIVTTVSGGKLKSVTIAFNAKTTDRSIKVYGKNEPYTDATDLFSASLQGDLIGTIAANDESMTVTPAADYKYVGLVSSNGAIYVDKITVEWEGSIPNIAGNELKGTAADMQAAGKYILAKPEGEAVGFYLANGGMLKAGKAYLELPEGSPKIKAFYFDVDDETGIANVEKAAENGAIYNLAGQRINKMQKGINIVNGKKVLK